jgi:hypothetical protein
MSFGADYLPIHVSCETAKASAQACALAGGRLPFFGQPELRDIYTLSISPILLFWFVYVLFSGNMNATTHK